MADDTETPQDAAGAATAAQPVTEDDARYEISEAQLTDHGEHQVLDHIEEAVADGSLTHDQLQDEIHQAEEAQQHLDAAKEARDEQAHEAEAGHYDKAEDAAGHAAYELAQAHDEGGVADAQVVDAQKDHQALDNASWEQATAHEDASAAVAYYDAGDVHHGDQYADSAADHHDTADAHADHHDAGGSYGEHDASASTDTSPEATTEA